MIQPFDKSVVGGSVRKTETAEKNLENSKVTWWFTYHEMINKNNADLHSGICEEERLLSYIHKPIYRQLFSKGDILWLLFTEPRLMLN